MLRIPSSSAKVLDFSINPARVQSLNDSESEEDDFPPFDYGSLHENMNFTNKYNRPISLQNTVTDNHSEHPSSVLDSDIPSSSRS